MDSFGGREAEDNRMVGRGINITHVVINEHGPIFAELIELLADALRPPKESMHAVGGLT